MQKKKKKKTGKGPTHCSNTVSGIDRWWAGQYACHHARWAESESVMSLAAALAIVLVATVRASTGCWMKAGMLLATVSKNVPACER